MYAADSTKWHAANFSKACQKTFVLPSSNENPEAYINGLIDLIQQEHLDLIIPTSEETLPISQNLHRLPCKVFCSPFDKIIHLHNKWYFAEKLKNYGMKHPRTCLVNSEEDLQKLSFKGTYCLKPSYSRAATHLFKVEAGQEPPKINFQDKNPWIAQEWIEGRLHCTFSVCHEGQVLAHSVYPIQFSLSGHYCISFESIDHPKIQKWVQDFVAKENYTGQIAFDFIQTEDGEIYPLECNPRCTSGIHLFPPELQLEQAYLNKNKDLITAPLGFKKQITVAMVMSGWRYSYEPQSWSSYLRELLTTGDVLFSKKDPLPFFIEPLLFIHYVWKARRMKMTIPSSFVYSSEWNG